MANIDILADVAWTERSRDEPVPDGLYATHEGVFEFCGHRMRCYRLNDGRAIFNADDFNAFTFEVLGVTVRT